MKDKMIKHLQYDAYQGQLRVVSDLPAPQSAVACSELQAAHDLTLLYYFVPHDPPLYLVRHARSELRIAPWHGTAEQRYEELVEDDSYVDEEHVREDEHVGGEDDDHVEDDERSWHSLHADEGEEEDETRDAELTRDTHEPSSLPRSESDPDHTVQHVRGYESLRLLSHVLVLETVSAEHSLTSLLSHQARDSPPPMHHVSRYFRKCSFDDRHWC